MLCQKAAALTFHSALSCGAKWLSSSIETRYKNVSRNNAPCCVMMKEQLCKCNNIVTPLRLCNCACWCGFVQRIKQNMKIMVPSVAECALISSLSDFSATALFWRLQNDHCTAAAIHMNASAQELHTVLSHLRVFKTL